MAEMNRILLSIAVLLTLSSSAFALSCYHGDGVSKDSYPCSGITRFFTLINEKYEWKMGCGACNVQCSIALNPCIVCKDCSTDDCNKDFLKNGSKDLINRRQCTVCKTFLNGVMDLPSRLHFPPCDKPDKVTCSPNQSHCSYVKYMDRDNTVTYIQGGCRDAPCTPVSDPNIMECTECDTDECNSDDIKKGLEKSGASHPTSYLIPIVTLVFYLFM